MRSSASFAIICCRLVPKSFVVSSSLTALGLAALPPAPRGSIAGSITAPSKDGILVAGGGSTAISDLAGNFVLFNVTPGAVTVRGYAAGVQLAPATTTVTDGARSEGVVLAAASTPLSTVTGSISIPNPVGCTATSVLLVLEETFNMTLERGEVPRGLRTGNVPILPGIEPPRELLDLDPRKVVGLLASAQTLVDVRRARVRALGVSPYSSYADPEVVEEELRYARRLFRAREWRTVDITGRAVEENAARVLELVEPERPR